MHLSLFRSECYNLQRPWPHIARPPIKSFHQDQVAYCMHAKQLTVVYIKICMPPPPTGDQPTPAPQAATRPSPPAKGWVTKKELLFVFLACSLAAGLLRTRDTVVVEQAWREKIDVSLYRSGRFPLEDEKLPPPIVTDLDSDGISGESVAVSSVGFFLVCGCCKNL